MSSSRTKRNTSIYIIGPSSTGKTTLCAALAKRFNLPEGAFVTEVARQILRTHGYTRKDIGLLEMQKTIMEAQLIREEEARRLHPMLQLCDRSAIDAIVYAILTANNDEHAKERRDILIESESFQRALPIYQHSKFMLLTPVKEWLVDDGVRHMDDQMRCLQIFREVLKDLGIVYRELGPEMQDLSKRVQLAMGLAKL